MQATIATRSTPAPPLPAFTPRSPADTVPVPHAERRRARHHRALVRQPLRGLGGPALQPRGQLAHLRPAAPHRLGVSRLRGTAEQHCKVRQPPVHDQL